MDRHFFLQLGQSSLETAKNVHGTEAPITQLLQDFWVSLEFSKDSKYTNNDMSHARREIVFNFSLELLEP